MWRLLILFGLLAIPLSSANAQNGDNAICLLTYNDLNENGVRDAGELPLAGVSVNLAVDVDLIFATHISDASGDAYCFERLPAGTYALYFAESTNHRATTQNSVSIEVSQGQRIRVEFGAVPTPAILTEDMVAALRGDELTELDTLTRILIAVIGATFAIVFMAGFGIIIVSALY